MTRDEKTARCWAEIDLRIVKHNYETARACCPGARVIPVLKADAYGLGARVVAKTLYEAGADFFAVATFDEAEELRGVCAADVLVMGITPDACLARAIEARIVITLADIEQARLVSRIAQRMGAVARAHIKIDTGLHRLGFDCETALDAAREIFSMAHVRVEGLFTHLALRSRAADDAQIAKFCAVADALRAEGHAVGMLHALDSIGMAKYPAYHFDAVRVGAWLYGSYHRAFRDPALCPLAIRLRARITQIRQVRAGECLGYDADHPLARDSVIATVSCGYYDGIPRANARGYAEVRGVRAPIAGLVMMDQLTLDVTDIPDAARGDAVTLLGDGISLAEAAEWYSCNRNELIARLSRRVARVYVGE